MTAPSRQFGRPVQQIVSGCTGKNRYSDEYGCRASGQIQEAISGVKLYLYRCSLCRGWHLTKSKQRQAWQAVSYEFKNQSKPAA